MPQIPPSKQAASLRVRAGVAVLLLHCIVGWAVLTGRTPAIAPEPSAIIVTLLPPGTPKFRDLPPPRPKVRAVGGSPAPARPIVAPPVLIPTLPILVASDVPAPNEGTGEGEDSGASGTGTGSGLGSGEGGTHSRWVRGRISRRDYPRAAEAVGASGKVAAKVIVGPDGRVAGCEVIESSGNADLDATTCRLITRRFRYEPGRDANGDPVTDEWVEETIWTLRRRDEPD